MTRAIDALRSVDFHWVRSLGSIWSDDPVVGSANTGAIAENISSSLFTETIDPLQQPLGIALVGQSGIGKTHLVGTLRQQVWKSGGWFVLLDVLGLTHFWRNAALSFLTSLLQEMPGGQKQFEAVIAGVAKRLNCEMEVMRAFALPDLDATKLADLLLTALLRIDQKNALQHADIFRALCLLRSQKLDAVSIAHSWLQGYDADETLRQTLGLRLPPPQPAELVRGMSWLMSLAAPTLVAIDQIDGVINPTVIPTTENDIVGAPQLAEELAAGLLDLHNVCCRSLTVVTCLHDSWNVLEARGLSSFRQRFRDPIPLHGMNKITAVYELIVGRTAPAYAKTDFSPPFPSWPFSEHAIESAASVGMTPRTILMRCDAWRHRCLDNGHVDICNSLIQEEAPQLPGQTRAPDNFDIEFGQLQQTLQVGIPALFADDGELGKLLRDTFDIYANQIEPDESFTVESRGDPARRLPPLDGRLTFTNHAENDRERHYCYRTLEHQNAVAFQSRLRAALTASGISSHIPDRHLLIVRRASVPSGPKTQQLVDQFRKAGGIFIDPSDVDLRKFVALRTLRDRSIADKQDAFERWLRRERPLLDTDFFKQAGLSPMPQRSTRPGGAGSSATPYPQNNHSRPATDRELRTSEIDSLPSIESGSKLNKGSARPENVVAIGRRMSINQDPIFLPTSLLRRHAAIIAGSGSGKTVLLRRIVEESALAGIPAIVIDPNNDLSRFGDAWPEAPGSFTAEDASKAQQYFDKVEVIVWTPGVNAGNPIFLSVLPNFAGLDDPDESQQAIEMAAETLAPLADAKRTLPRGVLVEALRYFARQGGGNLTRFIELLSDLPDGITQIGNADKLASKMANQLYAAVANNPLLRAEGPILDPSALFFGSGKRTRISVINLSGLASDAAREDFVNRLQMTLFVWIKRNPSVTGLLYVIDEAQTFLPSQKPALSLNSGIKLVSQGRKYGLGMIVATQAPKGLHNQVVSNCTTQFFGKQNAPATIQAAQEIIAANGGRADDIGKLKAGEFYFSSDGVVPHKIRAPICLSYHPSNPPSPDDVVRFARRNRQPA
ncbi:MAG: DUF853 family protein [Pseudorhodoplanes sp.]|nr:hypothetical protein [Pseudorhodoplanes sp.]MBW7950685.1 DUF853 family protein [Pseudorhodoplanes sp.]